MSEDSLTPESSPEAASGNSPTGSTARIIGALDQIVAHISATRPKDRMAKMLKQQLLPQVVEQIEKIPDEHSLNMLRDLRGHLERIITESETTPPPPDAA